MASMTAALRDRLANAAIAGLVGGRVYRMWRPQGDPLPSISFKVIDQGRAYHHGAADDLERPRVQFDIWGASPGQVDAVRAALIDELEPGATEGGVSFDHAKLISRIDFDPEEDASGLLVHRTSLDFHIYHAAAA
jgi:hypothetical protein